MFSKSKKQLAVLIDPENIYRTEDVRQVIEAAVEAEANYVFVGGSLVTHDRIDDVVHEVKSLTSAPVYLFPGGLNQISGFADGILFLSLISGRNPDFLISKQIAAAPLLKELGLEVIPTGYLLIGTTSSASYMSNTTPIPYEKNEIASATALAGQMLGHKVIYMDAGSGAEKPISPTMIEEVKRAIDVPLIVGGGIRDFDAAYAVLESGADVLVVGNAAESDPQVLKEISGAVKAANSLNPNYSLEDRME